MSVVNYIRNVTDAALTQITAEDIVWQAEHLGKLSVEPDWHLPAYKAQIRFNNRNGSTVWATGIDQDFFTAITKAVQESNRLK